VGERAAMAGAGQFVGEDASQSEAWASGFMGDTKIIGLAVLSRRH